MLGCSFIQYMGQLPYHCPQKYGEGKHYPSMTTALIRGLDNAYPITTQHWYNPQHKGITGRWTDDDLEEFKKVIDDDFEEIYKHAKNYKQIIFPIGGIFNSKISQLNKFCYICNVYTFKYTYRYVYMGEQITTQSLIYNYE